MKQSYIFPRLSEPGILCLAVTGPMPGGQDAGPVLLINHCE